MRRLASGVIALALAVAAGPARAQPAPPAGDAVAHYERGRRFYDLKEYGPAIEQFKLAYLADPAPGYLFNIAQAYRLDGDCTMAEDFFKKFLKADPASDKRDKIEKLIAECVPAPEPSVADPEPVTAAPVPAPIVERRVDRGRSRRIAGIVTAAAGGALLALGTGLAIHVSSVSSDLEQQCATSCDWEVVRGRDASARTQSTISTVAFVSGGAAVIAGTALYLWGRSLGHDARVGVVPTTSGAMVTARVGF